MNAAARHEPRAWSTRYWWSLATLVFLAQIALLFVFGVRKPGFMRTVTPSPNLQFASPNDEFMALNDPTLFALPHAHDFAAAKRMETPAVPQPSFDWSETPRWLPLTGADLLNSFGRYMQTNPFSTGTLDFKPEPTFSEPTDPTTASPTLRSTLTFRGDLARRALLQPIELKNWPAADVIAPSKVQVLVNPAGQVVSAVLLPSDSGIVPSDAEFEAELRDVKADQRALALARGAQFAPGSGITMGQMIFSWHAQLIKATATNTPPSLP